MVNEGAAPNLREVRLIHLENTRPGPVSDTIVIALDSAPRRGPSSLRSLELDGRPGYNAVDERGV
jgi:hypothetical protein